MRKWIEPKNIKLTNDNLSMVYIEPSILSTNFEHSKHDNYVGNKEKKQKKSQKKNFK